MAAFVVTRTIRAFDPRSWTRQQLVAMANNNQATVIVGSNTIDAADAASRKIYGGAQFEIFGTTDTNTAAASSPVLNLTDEGVIFPANTTRDIEVEVLAFNGSNRYRWRNRQRILGATDPTTSGPLQFLTDCRATFGITSTGTTVTEVAAQCRAPSWWDGASPVAADLSSNATTIQWLGTNSPVGSIVPVGISHSASTQAAAATRAFNFGNNNLTNGTTAFFVSDVATPTAANFTSGDQLTATAIITPPVDAPVLIDTATTPDKVFIGALGLSSDVVTWAIRVFIGDLVSAGPLV